MERQQFGKPIGEFQLIQAMLADSRTESYAARTMIMDAGRRRDLGVSGDSWRGLNAGCALGCHMSFGRWSSSASMSHVQLRSMPGTIHGLHVDI